MVLWIEDNVTESSLSANTIAQAQDISVRTVPRVFAGHGETFASTVRNIRLDRARREIHHGIPTITETASTVAREVDDNLEVFPDGSHESHCHGPRTASGVNWFSATDHAARPADHV
ncbi:MAG: hypothetical protein AAGC80_16735 [Rhodococcus sp. (in: high G+C Gram-positive bacteria)]